MMPPDRLETLRQVNQNLRSALARLRPEKTHCSAIRLQDFSSLLAELLRASECLRPGPDSDDTAALEAGFDSRVEKEALEYRANLEKLCRFLPGLHVRLLAEKARLEKARAHLAAAENWARLTAKTTGR
jgi:hypothetical protein